MLLNTKVLTVALIQLMVWNYRLVYTKSTMHQCTHNVCNRNVHVCTYHQSSFIIGRPTLVNSCNIIDVFGLIGPWRLHVEWCLMRSLWPFWTVCGLISEFEFEILIWNETRWRKSHKWTNMWNSRHLADDIFRCIFANEKFCILIKISLKFVPNGLAPNRRQTIIWTNADPVSVHWRICVAVGGDGLILARF